jgi:hypothetical protein
MRKKPEIISLKEGVYIRLPNGIDVASFSKHIFCRQKAVALTVNNIGGLVFLDSNEYGVLVKGRFINKKCKWCKIFKKGEK